MKHSALGHSGLKVSRLCLGMMSYGNHSDRPWVLDEEAAEPIVRAAVDAGITFFDTADVYSNGASEVATGKLLSKFFARDEVTVATKVFMPLGKGPNSWGLSRKHIMAAIDASLTRLNMDYVDLYQIHRFDQTVPVEETMDALHDLVKAGKVRYLGASSMYAWQFQQMQFAAERAGTTKFISMQNHYNLIYREEEREMLPLCRATGVGVIPWSPLARGFLTGSREREGVKLSTRAETDAFADTLYSDHDFDVVDVVRAIAANRGIPAAQVALAWLLHQDGVTAPIIGATKLGHLHDAVASLDVQLTSDEIAALEAPYVPHRIVGH
jgi:aryl-alcohol dehydrogenase-like predicted oxidoreductase